MKFKCLQLFFMLMLLNSTLKAQKNKADSLQLAKTLNELVTICRTVNFADPKVKELGTFYKAAPYIVYRGDDKNRAWKVFADYTNEYEKKGVDDICERINRTANQDSAYKIIKYITKTESEGTWHVLTVIYKRKGIERTALFAFLRIGNKFGLGDID
ncbi:MAG: hypothetical protein ABI685_14735 [Ferruginibacter sp.]